GGGGVGVVQQPVHPSNRYPQGELRLVGHRLQTLLVVLGVLAEPLHVSDNPAYRQISTGLVDGMVNRGGIGDQEHEVVAVGAEPLCGAGSVEQMHHQIRWRGVGGVGGGGVVVDDRQLGTVEGVVDLGGF